MKNRNEKALSLIGLLITLVLIAGLLVLALPNTHRFFAKHQEKTLTDRLVSALNNAREEAIIRDHAVTICPNNQQQCGKNWSQGLLLFIDVNHNHQLDSGEEILQQVQGSKPSGTLNWRGFSSNDYLIMGPIGAANATSGSFTYCPALSKDADLARAIIVNHIGRVRLSTVSSDGKAIQCATTP